MSATTLNDSQRGTVWEEIDHSLPNRRASCVAALGHRGQRRPAHHWIERVHGPPPPLVMSDHRPVPLAFSFCQCQAGCIPCSTTRRRACIPTARWWRAPKGGGGRKGKSSRTTPAEPAPCPFVVAQMAERDMLPPIYFHLSAAGACGQGGARPRRICLVSEASRRVDRPPPWTPFPWRPLLRRCGRAGHAGRAQGGGLPPPHTPGCLPGLERN